MPSPVGHALAGLAVGVLAAGPRNLVRSLDPPAARRPIDTALLAMLPMAALGVLPDFDLLFGMHSMYTHSLGAVVARAAGRSRRHRGVALGHCRQPRLRQPHPARLAGPRHDGPDRDHGPLADQHRPTSSPTCTCSCRFRAATGCRVSSPTTSPPWRAKSSASGRWLFSLTGASRTSPASACDTSGLRRSAIGLRRQLCHVGGDRCAVGDLTPPTGRRTASPVATCALREGRRPVAKRRCRRPAAIRLRVVIEPAA